MTNADQIKAPYRAYAEAFRSGMYAACNHVTREQANAIAHAMDVKRGDAYLAGYYAELRKLRFEAAR